MPLFAPVALGAGIALWFLLPLNVERQVALLLAFALAFAGLALQATARRAVVAMGLLLAFGLLAADIRSARVAEPRLYHRLTAAPITGTVESLEPQAGGERYSLHLRRDFSAMDPAVTVRLSLKAPLPEGLTPGARIRVEATLGPIPGPAVPGGHDPSRRAWFEGISASGRALAPPVILSSPSQGAARFDRLRQHLESAIVESLGGDAGAIAVALTVGEQGRIRPPLLEAMRVSGLAHILTVSGYHIAVVVAGAMWLLRRLLALSPWLALRLSVPKLAAIGAGVAGTAYTLLSGADLPAVRSIIAAWVVLAALMLGRDPLAPRLIAFAAFLILLARPEALLNPSFQLSFAAVIALVALARSPLGRRLAPQPEEGILPKLARFAAALLLTGLAAELVLTPIALAHFGRSGAYGVVANLAAIPLTSFLIMPLLAAWLFLAPFGLGHLVTPLLRPALEALAAIGLTVAGWPGASLQLPAIPQSALFPLAAGGLIFLLLEGRLRWAGAPLILAGMLMAALAPRPDLFVSADGRQAGILREGRLHTLRGHREGFTVRNWAEQTAAAASARFADLPGARCNEMACRVPLEGGLTLLAFLDYPPRTPELAAHCRAADIVTSPAGLPQICAPRWLRLDPPALRPMGAVAIDSRRAALASVGARAGDQPWSPAAPPGMRPRLLGKTEWTGVITE
nr:ComEC/Rec2 family competence protein [Sandaracinobacteroides sayramensis]